MLNKKYFFGVITINLEELAQTKANKKIRQSKIKEAVEKFPIQTQEELVNILNKHFNYETNQSAVSRDIKELKLDRDVSTGCYILGSTAKKKKERQHLAKLLEKANASIAKGAISTILLKVNAEYAPLIAAQVESYLALEKINASTFIGQNGALLVCVPKENEVVVQSCLKEIFDIEISQSVEVYE